MDGDSFMGRLSFEVGELEDKRTQLAWLEADLSSIQQKIKVADEEMKTIQEEKITAEKLASKVKNLQQEYSQLEEAYTYWNTEIQKLMSAKSAEKKSWSDTEERKHEKEITQIQLETQIKYI